MTDFAVYITIIRVRKNRLRNYVLEMDSWVGHKLSLLDNNFTSE